MKKRMLWLFAGLLASSLCVAPLVRAQYGKPAENEKPAQKEKPAMSKEDIQKRLEEAKVRLNLTDQQVEAIKPLFLEEGKKLRAIKEKYGDEPSRRDKRKMMKEAKSVQDSFNSGLEKILSADQMKIWKEMQEERRAKAKEEYERRQSSNK